MFIIITMNQQNKNKPFVLSGPSGVGKGTITAHLLKQYPDLFEKTRTFTTRAPRVTEQEGREYNFIKMEEFDRMEKNGEFFEIAHFNGNKYGSTIERVKRIMETGKICLLEIHVDSGILIQSRGADCHYIYLMPPSMDQLSSRLSNRQLSSKESLQDIQNRLKIAETEINKAYETPFYTKLVNSDLLQTVQNIMKIVNPS